MFNNQITKAYFDAGAQRNIMHRKCECGSSLKEFPSIKKKKKNKWRILLRNLQLFYKHWSQGQKRYSTTFEHSQTSKKLAKSVGQFGSSKFGSVTKNEDKSVNASEAALA
jgi:hypothetical protein